MIHHVVDLVFKYLREYSTYFEIAIGNLVNGNGISCLLKKKNYSKIL